MVVRTLCTLPLDPPLFSTLGMTPASDISSFFCFLILEMAIFFESDTVTGLHGTWFFDQLGILVFYFTLVVITVQAVESSAYQL